MTRSIAVFVLLMASLTAISDALANGDPVPTAAPPPPTHYERFLRLGCSPCMQESYNVKTLDIAPVKMPPMPGLSPGAEMPSRLGQIGLEVMRASQLGREARELLAVRVNLFAGVSSGAGQLFPLGNGVFDADDAGDVIYALNAMAKAASAAPRDPLAQTVDTDYRVGSFRVGYLRLPGNTIAYVQVGDIAVLAQRPVWQVPSTLFLGANQLPALAAALSEAQAQIRKLRTN